MSAVEVHGLGKVFDGRPALDDVSFSIAPGTVLGLLGVNGAGKTTTVRILSTLVRPDTGRAVVNGFDLRLNPGGIRKSIGLSGQNTALDAYLTGGETLELVSRLRGLPSRQSKLEATRLLKRFELGSAAGRQVRTYSGGMKRRLDLAVCLIGSPPVLFLDEPTAGLDPYGRRALREAVRSETARGAAVLLTTQQLEEAETLADELVVLHDGRVVSRGSTASVKAAAGAAVRLSVTVATADVESSAKILAASGASSRSTSEDECEITVSLASSREAIGLIARLADAGVDVRSLRLDEPTLDDVFISLTGASDGNYAQQI